MINPFLQINWSPDANDLKSFAKTLALCCTAVGGILLAIGMFQGTIQNTYIVPGGIALVGLVLFCSSKIWPTMLIPLYYPWFFLSACIGIVVSNLILTAFFYLIFSPFAVVMRLSTGRDPLQLKRKPEKTSYWNDSRKNRDLSRYLKQY